MILNLIASFLITTIFACFIIIIFWMLDKISDFLIELMESRKLLLSTMVIMFLVAWIYIYTKIP